MLLKWWKGKGSSNKKVSSRWYGYVLRKKDNDWVKKCMEYEVEGARPRGRPKLGERLWKKTVKHVD